MIKPLIIILLSTLAFNLSLAADTHEQLCENIRDKVSEDCSEESNTFDSNTGETIKRTYQECYDQDFAATVDEVNNYFTNKLGILTLDSTGSTDQIECEPES